MIPADELDTIIDNIGLPAGGFNLAFSDNPHHRQRGWRHSDFSESGETGPTAIYTRSLRKRLNEKFPDMLFFFEAANITNQILNFGLPAPIDVQVIGRDAAPTTRSRKNCRADRSIPGAADVHVHQVVDVPETPVER